MSAHLSIASATAGCSLVTEVRTVQKHKHFVADPSSTMDLPEHLRGKPWFCSILVLRFHRDVVNCETSVEHSIRTCSIFTSDDNPSHCSGLSTPAGESIVVSWTSASPSRCTPLSTSKVGIDCDLTFCLTRPASAIHLSCSLSCQKTRRTEFTGIAHGSG